MYHVEGAGWSGDPPCGLLLPLTLPVTDPIGENYIKNASWKKIAIKQNYCKFIFSDLIWFDFDLKTTKDFFVTILVSGHPGLVNFPVSVEFHFQDCSDEIYVHFWDFHACLWPLWHLASGHPESVGSAKTPAVCAISLLLTLQKFTFTFSPFSNTTKSKTPKWSITKSEIK